MTIEERARAATEYALCGSDSYGEAQDSIKRAIIAAVEDERESCAEIADKEYESLSGVRATYCGSPLLDVAEKIRARSERKGER